MIIDLVGRCFCGDCDDVCDGYDDGRDVCDDDYGVHCCYLY